MKTQEQEALLLLHYKACVFYVCVGMCVSV